MKPYQKNPRKITEKRFNRLADTLIRLGDLSGLVHNRRTGEIIGGNQRANVFKDTSDIVITEELAQPDEQGTVAHGFVVWRGKKYAYRLVDWDEATAAEANLSANLGAGEWDWDILTNEWQVEELTAAGFGVDLLKNWKQDAAALWNFIASEELGEVEWKEYVENEEGGGSGESEALVKCPKCGHEWTK